MELCLLFVKKRNNRIKQVNFRIGKKKFFFFLSYFKMASFLTKLSEENPAYLHLILFDENLFYDIRLLLINELISNRFDIKLISTDCINQFFHRINVRNTFFFSQRIFCSIANKEMNDQLLLFFNLE